MKKRSFETALLLLFLVHGLSPAGEFPGVPLSGDARFDKDIPQEKTIPPSGANTILDGCGIRPISFSDGLEAAVSL